MPLLALAASPLAAHPGVPIEPHDLLTAWSFDPFVLLSIGVPALLYWRGLRRLRERAGPHRGVSARQRRCFAVGIAVLVAALVSPLDRLGGALFSAHMAQHQLLMVLAAPLLVLGSPLTAMLWAFEPRGRRWLGGLGRRLGASAPWRALMHPLTAFVLHAAAIWLWHAPPFYELTLLSDGVHALQHASFVGTALLFWWSVLRPRSLGARTHLVGIVAVFATAVHGSALGALLTFAGTPWYLAYAGRVEPWGLTLLEDQQLGGLIMWVPTGFVYTGVALLLFAAWLRAMEQRDARREATVSRATQVLRASGR